MKQQGNRILVSELCTTLEVYMPKGDVTRVYQAYIVAASAHDGQYRRSGEPYVFHPIGVAMILAELRLDCHCIMAALLHDCIEDTSLTQADIMEGFGSEVTHMVEGVSKLTGLKFDSNIDKQAQNFRKLFLAMSTDIRVIIIKLADRLHNMRSLKVMSRDKQIRIAKETSEIHAPIARRLGLNGIRAELENLCFEIIHPYRNEVLTHKINKQFGNRNKIIKNIQNEIGLRLENEGLGGAIIEGRKKQSCSIYKKMKIKKLKFSEVLDMYAFRIVVDDVVKCYQALGVMHNLYKPLPGKFKDYIALPKTNGYQSLHTVLIGPNKIFIEIQIRTNDMHFVSEHGIAAHWHYKTDSGSSSELASRWLGPLLDIQKNAGTSTEFIEETKNALFPSEVFVFTPDGEIVQLPYESTVLDFAYAIHTKIGNKTIGAKIDNIRVQLSRTLRSGQTVEIITNKGSRPQLFWLDSVITSKAISFIKASLKQESGGELIKTGRYLLNNALICQGVDGWIEKEKWETCLKELKCYTKEELYMKIGLSEVLVSIVLNKIQGGEDGSVKKIKIGGAQGKTVSFAKCCNPIPEDKAVGILTSTKGLVMHRWECGNFTHAKRKNEQWLGIEWDVEDGEEFEVRIMVWVENRMGMLASISNLIAKIGVNIENIGVEENGSLVRALNLVISVPNATRLHSVMAEISRLKYVQEVKRL